MKACDSAGMGFVATMYREMDSPLFSEYFPASQPKNQDWISPSVPSSGNPASNPQVSLNCIFEPDKAKRLV